MTSYVFTMEIIHGAQVGHGRIPEEDVIRAVAGRVPENSNYEPEDPNLPYLGTPPTPPPAALRWPPLVFAPTGEIATGPNFSNAPQQYTGAAATQTPPYFGFNGFPTLQSTPLFASPRAIFGFGSPPEEGPEPPAGSRVGAWQSTWIVYPHSGNKANGVDALAIRGVIRDFYTGEGLVGAEVRVEAVEHSEARPPGVPDPVALLTGDLIFDPPFTVTLPPGPGKVGQTGHGSFRTYVGSRAPGFAAFRVSARFGGSAFVEIPSMDVIGSITDENPAGLYNWAHWS